MFLHRRLIVIVVVALGMTGTGVESRGERVDFGQFFEAGALRVDLIHSGTAATETVAVRRIVKQRYWAGNQANLIPDVDRGEYRVDIRDKATGTLIYRRGYSTLFGEWQTTAEADVVNRAFEETLLMPLPRGPVELEIAVRNEKGLFETITQAPIDPGSRLIGRGGMSGGVKVHQLVENGPPGDKVDLLILGDGYTIIEREKFLKDCAQRVEDFLGTEPFAAFADRFNFRAVFVASAESGIDEPRKSIYRDTPFGMSFNTFDSPRYCMTEDVWAIHDAAAHAPYDAILLMSNTSRYGGGAIYNFYTAFASDNEFDDYLCVHEFGHGFGSLGDEYYSSSVSYNDFYPRGVEPWEPNITALLDTDNLKWQQFVEPGTPIPTPADDSRYAKAVGAFEGAGYAAKGLYRPAVDCKMFSKGNREFCPVCSHAITEMIRFYAPD
ncbi:MAG: peptidase M64 [Candidatus Latescibacterota bacterium]|nr:MAG: peptidase M64 [Candidatus Latescibacterota bacterium]